MSTNRWILLIIGLLETATIAGVGIWRLGSRGRDQIQPAAGQEEEEPDAD